MVWPTLGSRTAKEQIRSDGYLDSCESSLARKDISIDSACMQRAYRWTNTQTTPVRA